MTDNAIPSFSFPEAVVKVRSGEVASMIAIHLLADANVLVAEITPDEDVPDGVPAVFVEKGRLFDLGGEEDYFDADQAPDWAHELKWRDPATANLSLGRTAEYAVYECFKDQLPDPADIDEDDASAVKEWAALALPILLRFNE